MPHKRSQFTQGNVENHVHPPTNLCFCPSFRTMHKKVPVFNLLSFKQDKMTAKTYTELLVLANTIFCKQQTTYCFSNTDSCQFEVFWSNLISLYTIGMLAFFLAHVCRYLSVDILILNARNLLEFCCLWVHFECWYIWFILYLLWCSFCERVKHRITAPSHPSSSLFCQSSWWAAIKDPASTRKADDEANPLSATIKWLKSDRKSKQSLTLEVCVRTPLDRKLF